MIRHMIFWNLTHEGAIPSALQSCPPHAALRAWAGTRFKERRRVDLEVEA